MWTSTGCSSVLLHTRKARTSHPSSVRPTCKVGWREGPWEGFLCVLGAGRRMKLSEQKLEPFMLLPGTQVGPWKVKAYAGGGAYGLVFRAVKAGEEQAGEVALKVA